MSKQSTPSPQPNSQNFSDEWATHPWIEWLVANRQILIWGVIGLFAALLLSYRLLSMRTLNAENDYLEAQIDFNQFQQASQESSTRTDYLEKLLAVMKRRPELHAKYDGILAQSLIIEGQIPEAKILAESTFQRVKPDHLTFYEDYAKTSLLISEGLYVEALQQALNLQKHLNEQMGQEVSGLTLYAFNQIRLAILYQQLGHSQEELAMWEAIQNQTKDNIKAIIATAQLFKAGQTSLNQYIEERKQALRS